MGGSSIGLNSSCREVLLSEAPKKLQFGSTWARAPEVTKSHKPKLLNRSVTVSPQVLGIPILRVPTYACCLVIADTWTLS